MTEETIAKYKVLLESGAISREEFDRMIAAEQPDGLSDIRRMNGCCVTVILGSVLTLILSFVFIPHKPHFSE